MSRVVIAVMDPTSRGEGGAAALRAAGVGVETDVLADEARLVLGAWLAAVALKRPVVTWAYAVRRDGATMLDGVAAGEIRGSVDAVLSEDGTASEGVPGSHGPGVLRLPIDSVPADPHDAPAGLYAGGVRSVLLHGGRARAEPFLAAGLIDRVVVCLECQDEQSSGPSVPWALAPEGFHVVDLRRFGADVRLECAVLPNRTCPGECG